MSASALEEFFTTGMQYYVAGRFGAFASLNPVAGNLLHHAIERILKGALSKSRTLADLKKLGHDLPTIWAQFKEHAKNDPALNNFDAIIAALAAFEELRYPDKMLQEGMQSVIALGGATAITNRQEPPYCLTLKTIDDLIRLVFTLASINPIFFSSGMNKIAREYLFKPTT